MTPEEEKIAETLVHLERRTDQIRDLHAAAEARRRAIVRSMPRPLPPGGLTQEQQRQLAEAGADLDRAEAALIEIGNLRRQFAADLTKIAGGGQDVGG